MAALTFTSAQLGFCFERPTPIEVGNDISDPAAGLFSKFTLTDMLSSISFAVTPRKDYRREPLSAWLSESYLRASLRDHLDVLTPPPAHLVARPVRKSLDLDMSALAPLILTRH